MRHICASHKTRHWRESLLLHVGPEGPSAHIHSSTDSQREGSVSQVCCVRQIHRCSPEQLKLPCVSPVNSLLQVCPQRNPAFRVDNSASYQMGHARLAEKDK